jgi:hypothetical protein
MPPQLSTSDPIEPVAPSGLLLSALFAITPR